MFNMNNTKTAVNEQPPKLRIKNFDEVPLGYSEQEAVKEAERCLQCFKKPCVSGCPVQIDIPAFIKAIKEKKFQQAIDIIHNNDEEFPIMVDIYSKIPATDTIEIKKAWNKFDHGLMEPILIKCDKCGSLFKEWPLITPDMFRPDTREQGISEELN